LKTATAPVERAAVKAGLSPLELMVSMGDERVPAGLIKKDWRAPAVTSFTALREG